MRVPAIITCGGSVEEVCLFTFTLVPLVPCSSFITCTMQEVKNNITILSSMNIFFFFTKLGFILFLNFLCSDL